VDLTITWQDQSWTLLGERALWWDRERTLILSDLHLGKAEDFQAAGIPVPSTVHDDDFERLEALLRKWSPRHVMVLGDLIHSARREYPELVARFTELRHAIRGVRWTLALGNHDVRGTEYLKTWGFDEIVTEVDHGGLLFAHDELRDRTGVVGHVHPVVKLKVGPDRMRLPCFVVGKTRLLLPSFGAFTGGYEITPGRGERIFVIAGREVVGVPPSQFR